MKLSVITPAHPATVPFLRDAWGSLRVQTHEDWEWVILLNGGAISPPEIGAGDARVSAQMAPTFPRYHVGWLKREAARMATGEVLVELDADDLLTPYALERIAAAFQDERVQFAYSNHAEFEHETWQSRAYSSYWGWRSRPYAFRGHILHEMLAWEPGPSMLRQIWWAPNHVRAWRRIAYESLGGHDPALGVGDDHDLCCRTYLAYGAAGMRHLDECLYLYRLHPQNTHRARNGEVQAQSQANYLRYGFDMAVRWARDAGLALYDLGGAHNPHPRFQTVDLRDADVLADLDSDWPFEDGSAGVLRASHLFEHLYFPAHAMQEAYRVLAPGGWLFVEVPSTDGRGAWQDPDHRSFWNENSFWYYTRREQARYVPEFKGRFQVAHLETCFPNEEWRRANIPVVRAHLIALKPPYDARPVGECLI